MSPRELLEILNVAEKLKCVTRHSDTSNGRRESVAEHCWRLSLTAMLLEEEFPDTDITRVLKMCIIHDLGEAFTGDIATFRKTSADREEESRNRYTENIQFTFAYRVTSMTNIRNMGCV